MFRRERKIGREREGGREGGNLDGRERETVTESLGTFGQT